ncbi:MAG: sigma-54-dependent transcriptional regulator [Magnetovibrionaceae bacterium]
MTNNVILIDDEEHLRTACVQALELADLGVDSFSGHTNALDQVNRDWPGVIVSDIRMPGASGLEIMAEALKRDPELPVILITGHGDVSMAVQAMRDGAYDFIEKPFASDILVDAVRRALEKRRLVLEVRTLRSKLEDKPDLESILVGRAPEMVRLKDEIRTFAATDADIMILGETGAGKEVVSRSLHDLSPRSGGRFVAINCGALPEAMIESELFGHEPGAFTGATKKRIGKIEHADGGTLFLDEIESMPLDLQVKLLRVLEDRKVIPLGSNTERPVDVRVIAATKECLRNLADEGRFREDLYYRLDVLTLSIPPLRNRRDDIGLLFQHFVQQAADRFKRPAPDIPPARLAEVMAHDWPGNVRELQNAALRFALGAGATPTGTSGAGNTQQPLSVQMEAFEKQVIEAALAQQGGSLKATYEALGISRKTLYDKMQRHGLSVD